MNIDAGDQVRDVASGREGTVYAVVSNEGIKVIFAALDPEHPEYTHTYSWTDMEADPAPIVKV